jgi:hypothetical protein
MAGRPAASPHGGFALPKYSAFAPASLISARARPFLSPAQLPWLRSVNCSAFARSSLRVSSPHHPDHPPPQARWLRFVGVQRIWSNGPRRCLFAPDVPPNRIPDRRGGFVSLKYNVPASLPRLSYTPVAPPPCPMRNATVASFCRSTALSPDRLFISRVRMTRAAPPLLDRVAWFFSKCSVFAQSRLGFVCLHRTSRLSPPPDAAGWLRFVKVQRIRRQCPSSA